MEPNPIDWFGPTWFSQISSPVAASSACTVFSALTRYMMPSCTSGIVLVGAAVVHRPDPRELEILARSCD